MFSNPALTFVLAIQPDLLQEIMTNEPMSGRGLLARFLYSMPISTVGSRSYKGIPIPKEVEERFRDLLFSMLRMELQDDPIPLYISTEGKARLEKYFYFIEGLLGKESIMRNWLAKHVGCVRRIAGNLHLASEERTSNHISLKTIEKAIEIGKYFTHQANYTFTSLESDRETNHLKEILALIERLATNPEMLMVKRRDLVRNIGKHIAQKTEELLPYLDLLEEYGYIKQVHMQLAPTHKKPSDLIFLNPWYVA
ncbi:MAG: DUF3987 domain-containing protein [Eubacteriales bacterium]